MLQAPKMFFECYIFTKCNFPFTGEISLCTGKFPATPDYVWRMSIGVSILGYYENTSQILFAGNFSHLREISLA